MKEKAIDQNYAKVESYVAKKRPPKEIRNRLDLGFKFAKNTFELFEIRPVGGSSDPNDYQKVSFAKFRYIKSREVWELYWMRASGKWESYEPYTASNNIDKVLSCIDDDVHGCFYG